MDSKGSPLVGVQGALPPGGFQGGALTFPLLHPIALRGEWSAAGALDGLGADHAATAKAYRGERGGAGGGDVEEVAAAEGEAGARVAGRYAAGRHCGFPSGL